MNGMPSGDPRRLVVRKFSSAKLATGAVAVAVAVGVVVVFSGFRKVLAWEVFFVPLAGAVGLSLVVWPVVDACASCNRRLEFTVVRFTPDRLRDATSMLRSGDVDAALKAADGDAAEGKAWLTLHFCPECRSTAVWKGAGERLVLAGPGAARIVERFGKGAR
jgi:hypothetical protein